MDKLRSAQQAASTQISLRWCPFRVIANKSVATIATSRAPRSRPEFTIPQRVFAECAARRQAWPIPYTDDDLLATWRGPHRLLLYVHIADPDDKWTVGLTLNGQPVELKKAYGDVYPLGRERTFVAMRERIRA